MKKTLLTLLVCTFVAIQSFAAPRIILEDNKDNYTQTTTGYILNFKLVSTSEEFVQISEQVESMSDKLKLQIAEGSSGAVDCTLTINDDNRPEYVYEMLKTIGIADLEYKGKVQGLETIVQILQSYL